MTDKLENVHQSNDDTAQQLRAALRLFADRLDDLEPEDVAYLKSDGGFEIIDERGKFASEMDGFAQVWLDDAGNVEGYTADPVTGDDIYVTERQGES